MDNLGSALLLGVFHSRKFDDRVAGKEPNRGQLFRDGVRSKALEDAGYIVRSLDDKHQEVVKRGDEIHCTANFADARRMLKALKSSCRGYGWRGSPLECRGRGALYRASIRRDCVR